MHVATVTLQSNSPLAQGRYHQEPKKDKEGHDDYERRTWRNKAHIDDKGRMFIPPMALKNCLSEVAKFLSIQIPGKGKATYTKHFEAGVLCMEPLIMEHLTGKPILEADIKEMALHVPSDGRRGGNSRVPKSFPKVDEWQAMAQIHILDDTITEDVFRKHLGEAGKFIGLGSFRVRNNGYFGRFSVAAFAWDSSEEMAA